MYFINTIITTNWDTYFEQYCAATPITIPEDFNLWDDMERSVLKIHGSISNLSTIVATKEDYKKCLRSWRNGIIGATLKTILATKTVVFIGFSFGDEDFEQILSYLKKEMNGLFPHVYVVTLDETLSQKRKDKNITFINTDGTYFLHELKLMMEQEKVIVNLNSKEIVSEKFQIISEIHNRLAALDFCQMPEIIYCLSYQDGILHSFDRFLQLQNTGKYYRPGYLNSVARSYDSIVNKIRKSKNYWDEAYFEGYLNGIIFIAACSDDPGVGEYFPTFYLPNAERELDSFEVFMNELNRVSKCESPFSKYAHSVIKNYNDVSMTIHHPPY